MCTVSVVPVRDGFRVACNRDEHRLRPTAIVPLVRAHANGQSVWPQDLPSGGTWIGANDSGLVIALLNRAGRRRALAARPTSRGIIIPSLLTACGLDAAADQADRELGGVRLFEPFTLVMVQGRRVAVVEHGDESTSITRHRLTGPVLFTSSSLGDDLVDGPRRRLFAELVESSARPLAGQAAFHRHRWRHRPEISVWMARADAVTVSRTVIDVCGRDIDVRYTQLSPHRVRAPGSKAERPWA